MTQATSGPELRPIPRIGDPAPDFEVVTTHGVKKLSDYRGNWVVLFSHPADFTPVCTTEMVGLAQLNAEFEARGAKLLGLSIDSIHAHVAWVENMRQNFGVEIPFPIIADLDMKVAGLYGMVHPGASSTATVRAVFFIDPEGVIQALIYYPLTNGRNLVELVRLLDSLQTSREHKVATPANWQKGERVIVPPPKTIEEVKQRQTGDYPEKIDFYLVKKDL
ncbi:MAG: peroxiredoxin [Gloeomargaritaceae cyanobacterium C42_A2020_066]|nr:peroxiredoxin [Gloeomargaritaceae cyanobacterium C42_A2020_066]